MALGRAGIAAGGLVQLAALEALFRTLSARYGTLQTGYRQPTIG